MKRKVSRAISIFIAFLAHMATPTQGEDDQNQTPYGNLQFGDGNVVKQKKYYKPGVVDRSIDWLLS